MQKEKFDRIQYQFMIKKKHSANLEWKEISVTF